MKATARANANIALVKYWGKRDDELILPMNGSISVTLSGLNTVTTVEFNEKLRNDVFVLNGVEQKGDERKKLGNHLDLVREKAKIKWNASVESKNNFPTAAGLASSASGFAALSVAAAKAAHLELNEKELSILARMGSGSASRSIHGGFVEWQKGTKKDGSDSYAEQIARPEHWENFRILTTIVSGKEKKVKSRAGMKQTVQTSPMYKGWLETVENDLENVRAGILKKNFSLVGETAEMNALKMHSTMLTTRPAIIYWEPETIEIMHAVQELREEGTECYFTIDAGPQVKVLCLQKNEAIVTARLGEITGLQKIVPCKVGGKAETISEHFF